jgi:hypothetical protein
VPPRHAVMIRGTPDSGRSMTVAQLRHSAGKPIRMGKDFYGLSVSTLRGNDSQRIARQTGLPHSYYSETTCGQLLDAGFDVRMTDERSVGHATIFFKERPTDDDLRKVIKIFSEPILNQARRG